MTQWQALGATAAGMGFFAALYGAAAYVDKASTVPYVRCLPVLGCCARSCGSASALACCLATPASCDGWHNHKRLRDPRRHHGSIRMTI